MDWGVILAGGSGTRFWPLSTPINPKQLLPLTGESSTAEAAVERLEGLIPRERVLVVTSPALAGPLAERLALPRSNILVEPRAASTAPALIWAAVEARRRDPEAALLSMHADWWIGDAPAFRRTAGQALRSAVHHDRLVTVGMVPTRPETGYGYIVPGQALDAHATEVARFQEKPDAGTALDLMAGGALWNSGLFAWTAARLLEEVRAHTPEVAGSMARLFEGDVNGFFSTLEPVSVDVGVLERSSRVAVVRGAFPWDDVGNWDALVRVRPRDERGNVSHGAAHMHDTTESIAWTDGTPVVLYGVSDLVVVNANGRILVMPRSKAAHLKRLLDALPESLREAP